MKISTKGRYGLRALIDLAAHQEDKCITLKSIAARQGISENYLEQLISTLKKAGFVKSVRGAQGGYSLGMPIEEISVGDVIRALEGSMYPVDCLSESQNVSCGSTCDNCVTRPVWEKIYESMNDVLDSFMLVDLVNDYRGLITRTGSEEQLQYEQDLL